MKGARILKRRYRAFNIEGQRWCPTGVVTIIPKKVNWMLSGYHPDELELDADGSIIGFKGSTCDRFCDEFKDKDGYCKDEQKILEEKDQQAEQLIETVDWTQLEHNFFSFVEQYREQLTP